jgi:D-glycero-D-manno-heptose 1,7-bisphosphate phosphatase
MNLIILDRDGTINEDRDDYIKSPEEWVPIPGSLEAIARLNHAGWHTVIATNQSGLGRGLFDMSALNSMHLKMNGLLAKVGGRIDAVFFCPHTPDDLCDCRKPLPGLITQIGTRFNVDLSTVHVVGDSLRDLQAGTAAGCPTHLVLTGKGRELDDALVQQESPGAKVHEDLAAFAEHMIQQERTARGVKGLSGSGFGRLD